jgi:hypothetical protein
LTSASAAIRPSRRLHRPWDLASTSMALLSGGRKPFRRGRSWTYRLWLMAAVVAGFVLAAALLLRL